METPEARRWDMIASARGEKDWRPLRGAAEEEEEWLVAARVESRRSPAAWLAGNPAMRRSTSTIDLVVVRQREKFN